MVCSDNQEHKLSVSDVEQLEQELQKKLEKIEYQKSLSQYKNAELENEAGYDTHFRFYTEQYDTWKIDENTVLIESYGNDFSGSMLKIMEYFNKNFKNSKVYVISESNVVGYFQQKLKYYNIDATVLRRRTMDYYKIALEAKYLISDSTFERFIAKRPGQIMINTWHGVPLKHMGFDINNRKLAASNIQRNFYNCDLIVQGSDFSKNCMTSAFSHFDAKVIGTPRNDLLYAKNRKEELRKELGIKDSEKVVLFAPTWHGNTSSDTPNELNFKITEWMKAKKDENIRLFYKPHQSLIHKTKIDGIEFMPSYLDITDFLNCVDILVTDYSSIMFDFAILNRHIILHVPTLENYIAARGSYIDMKKLPFTMTKTTEEIWDQIEKSIPVNYSEFNKVYNTFEQGNATENLFKELKNLNNEKKNVAIYPGTFINNENLFEIVLQEVIKNKDYEYHILLDKDAVENIDRKLLQSLPSNVKYYCFANILTRMRKNNIVISKIEKDQILFDHDWEAFSNLASREAIRSFGTMKFEYTIDLTGENFLMLTLLSKISNKTLLCYEDDLPWYKNKKMSVLKEGVMSQVSFSVNKDRTPSALIEEEIVKFVK